MCVLGRVRDGDLYDPIATEAIQHKHSSQTREGEGGVEAQRVRSKQSERSSERDEREETLRERWRPSDNNNKTSERAIKSVRPSGRLVMESQQHSPPHTTQHST